MGDWSTNTTSLIRAAPCISRKAPGDSVGLPRCLRRAGCSTSWMRVDFPDPETPVTHTRRLSGNSTSTSLRLCSVTPRSASRGVSAAGGREATPASARFRPERYSAVTVFALLQLVRRAEEHDLAAALARPRSHVEQAVGLQHDLRVVLHHHERVARVAQPLHHADHAAHVARMQADRRLVQHEERVHERGAQRRGEVDALHLAAGERARLAVEGEVAQAHLAHEAKPRVDFLQQQFRRLVQRGGQRQALEEGPRPLDGQQHHVVQAQARERGQLVEAPLRAARGIALLGGEHRVGLGPGAHAPEHATRA